MNTQIAGALKESVTTLAQASALAREHMDDISKIDWNTGEWAEREKRGATKPVRVEVLSCTGRVEVFTPRLGILPVSKMAETVAGPD